MRNEFDTGEKSVLCEKQEVLKAVPSMSCTKMAVTVIRAFSHIYMPGWLDNESRNMGELVS